MRFCCSCCGTRGESISLLVAAPIRLKSFLHQANSRYPREEVVGNRSCMTSSTLQVPISRAIHSEREQAENVPLTSKKNRDQTHGTYETKTADENRNIQKAKMNSQHPPIPPEALSGYVKRASDRATFVVRPTDVNNQHRSDLHRQDHLSASSRHDTCL